jgi:hypothetical protein
MGMFDSVILRCPECNEIVEHQSKAGRCQLFTYTLANTSLDILADIAKDTIYCSKGHKFYIKLQVVTSAEEISGDNPIEPY